MVDDTAVLAQPSADARPMIVFSVLAKCVPALIQLGEIGSCLEQNHRDIFVVGTPERGQVIFTWSRRVHSLREQVPDRLRVTRFSCDVQQCGSVRGFLQAFDA